MNKVPIVDSLSMLSSNHFLAIYSNTEEKLDSAFKFLRGGLLNNESILLISEDVDTDQAIDRLKKECPEFDVEKLFEDGIITIISTTQWYFPNNLFNGDQIKSKWKKAVDESMSIRSSSIPSIPSTSSSSSGKEKISGLRVFADTKPFFNKDKMQYDDKKNNNNNNRYGISSSGFAQKLIDYECSLEKRFSFDMSAICAYEAEDIATLDRSQLKSLMEHHGLIHIDNINEIVNPSENSHIILLYGNNNNIDDDNDGQELVDSVSQYINEGLQKGQLCVHASIFLLDEEYLTRFSSKIVEFDLNVKKGNLILIDLTEYYLDALTGDLERFDKLRDEIIDKAKSDSQRDNKHVRLTMDCSMFLLKNKHFEECISLENWWHKKYFEGSCLFPYPMNLLSQFPYNYYLFKIFHKKDVVIDSESNIAIDYVKNSAHQTTLASDMANKILDNLILEVDNRKQ